MTDRPVVLTRRGAVALGLAALACGPARAADETAPRVDTHAHVFHRGLPLAPGRRYAPDYDAPLALYLRQLDENGMTNGVLVQPSFLGFDNSYLVECLKAAPQRLRGIAVVDPTTPVAELDGLAKVGVVGVRLNLVGQPLPNLDDAATAAFVDRVKGLDWQIEIQRNATDLAPLAATLIKRGVNVVLDHFGLPDPKLGVEDPGFKALLALGPTGKAFVKISAPYRNGPEGRDFAKRAYPLLRDAFGLDHVMWGSDWPHTQFEKTESYARNLAFLDEMVVSADERARILAAPKTLFKF